MSKFIRMSSPLLFLLAVAFLVMYPHATPTGARDVDTPPLPEERPAVALAAAPPPGANVDWSPVMAAIQAELEWFPGRLSVVAEDLTTGERFVWGGEEQYHPASTMKVAVALCVAQAVERGELTWASPVALTEADLDPEETTELDELPLGTPLTVQELVTSSLAYSSNVATHMLIRTLTPDGLLDCTTRLGGPVTRAPGGSTPVTAESAAAWWKGLWNLRTTAPADAEVILTALRGVTYTGRIAAGTPEPAQVTHKFGSVDDYFHDGAIVWAGR
ncbi:MAG TPA: serine hydrolase, partial [Symbiobacteriaceae bacterium]|nr:serine hydrolase [Symbiobacteriaceae bacterium]